MEPEAERLVQGVVSCVNLFTQWESVMKFDAWWSTLTTKEQNMIGVNNARFVWSSAVDECARVAESYEPRCDTCPSGIVNAIKAVYKPTE